MPSRGRAPRQRQVISRSRLTLMRPFLRYSSGRGAWVLRLVGNTVGPVYVLEGEERIPKDPSEWQAYPLGHEVQDPADQEQQAPPA